MIPQPRARFVPLLNGSIRRRNKLTRAAPGTGPKFEYGRQYRQANASTIASSKAKWAKDNALQVRVYHRIWAREKRRRTGSPGYARGERNPFAKLDVARVRALRARYAAGGVSIKAVAQKFGVTQTAAWKVIRRETWAHVA